MNRTKAISKLALDFANELGELIEEYKPSLNHYEILGVLELATQKYGFELGYKKYAASELKR